jgi:glycine C-acetyltransferase
MTAPDVAACIEAVKILEESDELVSRLWQNAALMRGELQRMGFDTGHSQTPIIPLMLGEARLAQAFSRSLLEHGVFAMAIGYPTVPLGKARIRVMNSAAHSQADLEQALDIFARVGRELDILTP